MDYRIEEQWSFTIEFIQEVKSAIGEPEQSIFQSWREYPRQPLTRRIPINLPEDDPSIYSHTRLINDGLDILGEGQH